MTGLKPARISVAMCTFQGERYLEDQLASIAAQTRLPEELIVSDDRSSDGTVAIVERFATHAPFPVRISVVDAHLGVVRNYERAIKTCQGNIIVLSDQDDIWLPHKLDTLERIFNGPDEPLLAFSDAYHIRPDGTRTGDRLWSIAGFSPAQQQRMREDPFGQLMGRSIVSGCTLSFRASGLGLLMPFPGERTDSDLRLIHDRWISMVLASVGPVAVIDDPLIEYRIHDAQQIGIPALQIRKLVPSSLLRWRSAAVPTREHTARLEATIGLLHLVAARVPADARPRVEDAIAHLRARASIDGWRAKRLAGVVREFLTGRYHRYSLGTASAVADVVRPGETRFSSGAKLPRTSGATKS